MYDPLFSEKMKEVLCYGSQELTADKVYSNAYERQSGIALNFMYSWQIANQMVNGMIHYVYLTHDGVVHNLHVYFS